MSESKIESWTKKDRVRFESIRAFLERVRKMSGITQGELAELIGCSRDVIANCESGRTPWPLSAGREVPGLIRSILKSRLVQVDNAIASHDASSE
jgi:predicted transcriptional regulator